MWGGGTNLSRFHPALPRDRSSLHALVELIAFMYEQEGFGEVRYNQDGHRWLRAQFFAPGVNDAAASQEWALAGRRSIAVAMLIPTKGLPASFSEHQPTLAARCLVQHLFGKGPIQIVIEGATKASCGEMLRLLG